MANHYDYSVIIPHYNSPKLLERCLASIPDREDIEVIVVDDNSSPEMVDFDHFPGLDRKNTKIIFNKDSYGAGHARNLALPQAKGKWLIFADADDYFMPNAWTTIQHVSERNKADIIYLNIQSVDSETGEVLHDRGNEYIKNITKYVATKNQDFEYRLRFWNNTPWGKIIRHQIVVDNNIVFGETKHANDALFSTKTAIAAQSVDATPEICYCVTRTKGSLTQDMSIEARAIRYEVCLQKNQLLRDAGYGQYEEPIHPYLRFFSRYKWAGLKTFISLTHQYHGSMINSLKWYLKRKCE